MQARGRARLSSLQHQQLIMFLRLSGQSWVVVNLLHEAVGEVLLGVINARDVLLFGMHAFLCRHTELNTRQHA